jgi:endonuclease/exonuclease/phosphatase family metal-dependent hydrolase
MEPSQVNRFFRANESIAGRAHSHRPDREIDFVPFRPSHRFAVVESRAIEEPIASDHRPVLLVVEIRLHKKDEPRATP